MSDVAPQHFAHAAFSDDPELAPDREKESDQPQPLALDNDDHNPEVVRKDHRESPRTIGGLRVATFWLSAAVAAAVIIAVAVGGSVGGVLASRDRHSSQTVALSTPPDTSPLSSLSTLQGPVTKTITTIESPTLSTSSSSTSPSATSLPTAACAVVSTDCPDTNGSVYNSHIGAEGTVPIGASNGLTFVKYCNVGIIQHYLSGVYVYTYNDCVEACAAYNFYSNTSNCNTAAFLVSGARPVNCWIGSRDTSQALVQNGTTIWDSAVLQSQL